MNVYITTRDELVEIIDKAVKKAQKKELPILVRKAMRKEWLNTNELIELTGWSRRTIQNFRDAR